MSGGMSFYLVAISPAWHGQRLGGLVLPIHQVIPPTLANLAAGVLALAAWHWLTHPRAFQHTSLICQKCNRLFVNAGQTQCVCGGTFSCLYQMKWVAGRVSPENRPPQPTPASPKNTVPSQALLR